jgi:succinylarginine dihydrolase
MVKKAQEWQFDGLVGPSHNYAGLAVGNMASQAHSGSVSNPREAALQGLEKMRFVQSLGVKQAFLPPHPRPIVSELVKNGYEGGIKQQLSDCYSGSPALLAAVFSSAFMWAANAATTAPSGDGLDGKIHITPANLLTNYHRALEPGFTSLLFRHIFSNEVYFKVHDPLVSSSSLSDEGAANHMRVCTTGHTPNGLHIFVYGADKTVKSQPKHYPARQQLAASEAIARLHKLSSGRTLFVQQLPEAIDAGVFHNDVIAMNTTRLMVAHEKSFVNQSLFVESLMLASEGMDFTYLEVAERELPLATAVSSYFFNSQMLELPNGNIVIVAPAECREQTAAKESLERLAGGNGPVTAIHYQDVRESMKNGGGPACLRLRIVMTPEESAAMHQGVILTDPRYEQLVGWVKKHYRDRLSFEDLRDPEFVRELEDTYAALEPIIGMPGLYTSRMPY